MLTICRTYRFEAAHALPLHNGQCRRLHGHSYVLEVSVSGRRQHGGSSSGMVLDYADLDKLVNEHVISLVDHYNLNDVLPEPYQPTTAENIACWAFDTLEPHVALACCDAPIKLTSVRVWETARSWAERRAI